jgi:hypothetical protein
MATKSNDLKNAQELAGELASRLGLEVRQAHDPDAARVRAVKIACAVVPSVGFGVAGLVSVVLIGATAATHTFAPPYWLAGLLVVWGGAALATSVTVARGFALLKEFRAPAAAPAGAPPAPAGAAASPGAPALVPVPEGSRRITRDLEIDNGA